MSERSTKNSNQAQLVQSLHELALRLLGLTDPTRLVLGAEDTRRKIFRKEFSALEQAQPPVGPAAGAADGAAPPPRDLRPVARRESKDTLQ